MITLEQVQAQAEKVVETFGWEHRNPSEFGNGDGDGDSCLYTTALGHHCFAGQILVGLGVEVPAYGDEENRTNVDSVERFQLVLENDAMAWLSNAQGHADAGNPWVACMDAA